MADYMKDYPPHPDRRTAGNYVFNGWKGHTPSKKDQSRFDVEIKRLQDYLCQRGWDLEVFIDCKRGSVNDPAVVRLSIFVNGQEGGYSAVPKESFWDANDENKRWYGIRIFIDDVMEKAPRDKLAEMGYLAYGRSFKPCLDAMLDELPGHVNDLIAFFERYPRKSK